MSLRFCSYHLEIVSVSDVAIVSAIRIQESMQVNEPRVLYFKPLSLSLGFTTWHLNIIYRLLKYDFIVSSIKNNHYPLRNSYLTIYPYNVCIIPLHNSSTYTNICYWELLVNKGSSAAADQWVCKGSHLFFQQKRVGCLSTRLPAA